jgi:hypothetical protein
MISTGGNNLFVTGAASQALVIPTSGSFGLNGFSNSSADAARRSALEQLLNVDQTINLTQAAQAVMSGALTSSAILNPILTTTDATLVRALQRAHGQLLATAAGDRQGDRGPQHPRGKPAGVSRDARLVRHAHQPAQRAANPVQPAGCGLTAFHGAMADIGAGTSVTSFTLSDFSRNFLPNTGGGTDHAWGSHPLVIGDAVNGGASTGRCPRWNCPVPMMRATWAAGFRRSPSINLPRPWRRGSAPTRQHSPRCCRICRHSVQARSGSSDPTRRFSKTPGGANSAAREYRAIAGPRPPMQREGRSFVSRSSLFV